MKELILLRHAETEANARGILQGRDDYPLSERGLVQARRLAPLLSGLGCDLVVQSPAGRVTATLAPALELGLTAPLIWDDLVEIDLGELAGVTIEDFTAHYAAEVDPEVFRRGEYRYGGGETRRELFQRAAVVWERLLGLDWRRCLVASHGGFLSQLTAAALGMPNDGRVRFRLDNACLSRLLWYDGLPFLSRFNEAGHLEAEHRSPPFTPRTPSPGGER